MQANDKQRLAKLSPSYGDIAGCLETDGQRAAREKRPGDLPSKAEEQIATTVKDIKKNLDSMTYEEHDEMVKEAMWASNPVVPMDRCTNVLNEAMNLNMLTPSQKTMLPPRRR